MSIGQVESLSRIMWLSELPILNQRNYLRLNVWDALQGETIVCSLCRA